MHVSIATALSAATLVSGAAINKRQNASTESVPLTSLFPALPLSVFAETAGHTLTLEEAIAGLNITGKINDLADKVEDDLDNLFTPSPEVSKVSVASVAATCSTVRVRQEWDSVSTSDRQNFVDSVKCLMDKAPSGQFSASKSRYEDLVALHQTLTPRVHNSSKFLLWHRYLLWTFEQLLRDECSLTAPLPWFDETKYAGKFSQSSIFSSQWMGGIAIGGKCVTDGVSQPYLAILRVR